MICRYARELLPAGCRSGSVASIRDFGSLNVDHAADDRFRCLAVADRVITSATKRPRTTAELAPSLTIAFAPDVRARDLDVAALLSDQVCPDRSTRDPLLGR
jgi:hypothetical protein